VTNIEKKLYLFAFFSVYKYSINVEKKQRRKSKSINIEKTQEKFSLYDPLNEIKLKFEV
jgi:hypothetical protein